MSVGLLLVTHNRIGEELLHTACATLGLCPLKTRSLEVVQDSDPDRLLQDCEQLVRELDQGDGILVLTDAFGSTPSNIAMRLGRRPGVAVVSGLNLPMLLRVMNYPQLRLEELQLKAVSGGQDGVLLVKQDGVQ